MVSKKDELHGFVSDIQYYFDAEQYRTQIVALKTRKKMLGVIPIL